MPKQTYFSRYLLIIQRLEKSPATFKEIQNYLDQQSEIRDENLSISIRTFQRDIKEIYSLMNYEIVCERTGDKKYFIKESPEEKQISHRLLESFEMINAVKTFQENKTYIFYEQRQSKGLEHFSGLLFSIQNKRIINFEHFKYYDDIITQRTVHPLALKESLGRWYLIAIDKKDATLKTFGLDRIKNLDISKTSFKEKYTYNLELLFKNSFGVIGSGEGLLEDIELEFMHQQGMYIKSYPLHQSQKILLENKNKVIVSLKLNITYDFIMEIIKYNEEVRVLKPMSLAKEIKSRLTKTLKYY